MSTPTYDAIRAWLDREGAIYRALHHEPTRTSEESARIRGEPLEVGGKALLLKVGEEFRLFVLPANRKLDSNAVRNRFDVKRVRFADTSELLELTGLVPGSVPPFGRPILPFELYADESIAALDRIAFNAGSLTHSIIMPMADYLRVANPALLKLTQIS